MNEEGEIGVYYPKRDIPEKANVIKNEEDGKKRSNKKGSWRVFENGEETQAFKGDWTPKATTNWLDDIIYRQQIK